MAKLGDGVDMSEGLAGQFGFPVNIFAWQRCSSVRQMGRLEKGFLRAVSVVVVC